MYSVHKDFHFFENPYVHCTLRPPRGSRNQTFSDGFGFVLLCFALFALFCFLNLFYLAFLSLFTQCLALLCLVLLPSLHFLLGSHAHTKNKKVWYSIITLAKFGMVSRRLNFGCLLGKKQFLPPRRATPLRLLSVLNLFYVAFLPNQCF